MGFSCSACQSPITPGRPHYCTPLGQFISNYAFVEEGLAKPEPRPAPELAATPIRGHRIWRVYWDDGPRLVGVGYSIIWKAPVMEANCELNNRTYGGFPASAGYNPLHFAPDPHGCHCGIWLLKNEKMIPPTLATYGNASHVNLAWGEVEAWGRVIEHKRGWRAQYARPRKIYTGYLNEVEVAELAERYQCEVVRERFPLEDIEEIRDKRNLRSERRGRTSHWQPAAMWVTTSAATTSAAPTTAAVSNVTTFYHLTSGTLSPQQAQQFGKLYLPDLPPPQPWYKQWLSSWATRALIATATALCFLGLVLQSSSLIIWGLSVFVGMALGTIVSLAYERWRPSR